MKNTGLGKGIDSLIPTNFDLDNVVQPGESIKKIKLDKIVTNPDQPRKEFDEKALKELADSISQHGIIQPLVVTPSKDKFRIVAGERRYRAANIAKLDTVPVIIRNHAELEELEIALVENVQRVDLSPLEQAVSILKLRDQFSLSHKEIAKKLGKAETTISNITRLVQLPKEAIQALQKNQISEGHARAILALKTDKNAQKDLLNKIITQHISVREAEDYVKKYRDKNINKNSNTEFTKASKQIEKSIGFKTKITKSGSGGKIQISFKNNEELQKIKKLLT